MSDKLSLPASSYDQLTKIIRGYSLSSENIGLDELAKLVGISKTRVSANHKLLIEIGLITGGNKKSATPLGKNLGHAIEHNQEEDIRSAWQKAIKGNERMSSLITTVSIKGGMSPDELLSHILYVLERKSNKDNRRGARTISDILVASGLLEEQDDQLKVPKPIVGNGNEASEISDTSPGAVEEEINNEQEISEIKQPTVPLNIPTVAINIQLQIPETENADVYENLFKALRKHLLNPDE